MTDRDRSPASIRARRRRRTQPSPGDRRGLEADGFAVAQALDGADAIARLQGFAYDGLVVDLRLPDANGMDVLDEALTLFPTSAPSSSPDLAASTRRSRRSSAAPSTS